MISTEEKLRLQLAKHEETKPQLTSAP